MKNILESIFFYIFLENRQQFDGHILNIGVNLTIN